MSRGPRIGEVLLQAGLIDQFQLDAALGQQQRWGGRLGRALVAAGFLDEETLVRALAQTLRLPVVDLVDKRPAPDVLELLPAELAEKYACLPLFTKREGGKTVLFLGLEDPLDLAALDELAFRLGMPVRPVLVGPTALRDALARFYHPRARGGVEPGSISETPLEPGDTAPVFTPLLDERDAVDPGPLGVKAPEPTPPDVEPPAPEPPPAAGAAAPPPAPPAAAATGLRAGSDAPEGAISAAAASPSLAVPAPAAAATGARKPRDVSTRVILQALTQLLIEKGVLGRDELLERVRQLGSGKDGGDPQP